MSNTNNYLPVPPRAWYRVNNICYYDVSLNSQNNDNIYDPSVFYKIALINKGNVLQYKKNSTNLTKIQRYSQIAKGLWKNRTKTWATQTATYTNPNQNNLKRVGYVEYPNNTPTTPSGPYIPVNYINYINDPVKCPNLTFKDGGNLVCGVYQNPCTGQVIEKPFQNNYYPTSDSDVPGPIQELYWNPKLQTWYPKVRRIMNNTTDKWPVNYKLFKSAIYPDAPVLSGTSFNGNSINLSWTIKPSNCYPITQFNIFVNNNLYKAIPYTNSYVTTLTGLNNKESYQIYIESILSGNASPPSNILTIVVN